MKPRKAPSGDPQRCENCLHFRQHYVLISPSENHYNKCGSGHCLAIRSRGVKWGNTCSLFREKEQTIDENCQPL